MEYEDYDPRYQGQSYARPAGFWLRVWAFLFDIAVLAVPKAIIQALAWMVLLTLLGGLLGTQANSQSVGIMILGPAIAVSTIGVMFASLIIDGIYNPVLESSALQGTLGKRFLGLIVVDANGERITFARGFARFLARWIAAVPVIISVIVVVAPLVVGSKPTAASGIAMFLGSLASGVLSLIQYPMAAFTQQKQTLHDKITSTYVVRARELTVLDYTLRALLSISLALALYLLANEFSKMVISSDKENSANSGGSTRKSFSDLLSSMKLKTVSTPTSEKPLGWREIKPLWTATPAKSSADPIRPHSKLALVTIKPQSDHAVTFEASRPSIIGFETIEPSDRMQARCQNNCITISAGNQAASGTTARIVATPQMKRIHLILTNREAFPIEVVIFREEVEP